MDELEKVIREALLKKYGSVRIAQAVREHLEKPKDFSSLCSLDCDTCADTIQYIKENNAHSSQGGIFFE